MSERGSFVTEYMYCPGCREKITEVLKKRGVDFITFDDVTSIIAGFLSSTYSGGEIVEFQYGQDTVLFDENNAPCHPVRFAVLAEVGQKFFTVMPDGKILDLDELLQDE